MGNRLIRSNRTGRAFTRGLWPRSPCAFSGVRGSRLTQRAAGDDSCSLAARSPSRDGFAAPWFRGHLQFTREMGMPERLARMIFSGFPREPTFSRPVRAGHHGACVVAKHISVMRITTAGAVLGTSI